MGPNLPAGTVTFLFTDIEGSTRLLERYGDRYGELLAQHRGVLREAFERHDGVEVDTQGDAFFVAFSRATDALAAAEQAQAELDIPVRMGIHTGEPVLTDEGYVGMDVHRAARVAAVGHGGQILVSDATRQLVGGESLRDLGEHRLKDLGQPVRLYQLGESEFPPLRTLRRTNLPVPATPFLGRERELGELVELLKRDDVALLTLTGPGGTGKTRLALQAAAECADAFPDGVWWAPLAPLRDVSAVLPALAQPLELQETPGQPLADVLIHALGGKKVLLLLDNVEHLLPEVAGEIARLRTAEGPVFFVTSRERLQLQGEQLYPVSTLGDADASALFVARARTLDPAFDSNGAIAELCASLDNLPLALELAAARTPLFTPAQLLERLSQRLDLLKAGRDADPRQQTLRATVEWSYDLLELDEQRLFRGLSVFAGGCTLEAAEEVCGADPDTLQSLLDKSLLRRRDSAAGPRYWMLETIRQYAFERLGETDEEDELRRRHAEWAAQLCKELGDRLEATVEPRDLGQLDAEYANVRAALEFGASTDPVLVARIAAPPARWWRIRGRYSELERWLEPLPQNELDPATRARVVAAFAGIALEREDRERLQALGDELLALGRGLPDDRLVCGALNMLTLAAFLRGDVDLGRALGYELIQHVRAKLPELLPVYLGNLGWKLRGAGLVDEARPLLDKAVALGRKRKGLQLQMALAQRANLALDEGEYDGALRRYRESLALGREWESRRMVFICLSGISAALFGLGRFEDAARLEAAADRLGRELTLVRGDSDEDERTAELRSRLGHERFSELAAAGRSLDEDEAVELALSAVD